MAQPTIENDDPESPPINDTKHNSTDGRPGGEAEAEGEVQPDTSTTGSKPNRTDECPSRGRELELTLEFEPKQDTGVPPGMVSRAKYQQVVDKVGYFERRLDLMERWMRRELPSRDRRLDLRIATWTPTFLIL